MTMKTIMMVMKRITENDAADDMTTITMKIMKTSNDNDEDDDMTIQNTRIQEYKNFNCPHKQHGNYIYSGTNTNNIHYKLYHKFYHNYK